MKNFIWITLLMASCSPVYVPNVRNTPLFRGAGEVQVSGHVDLLNGLDGQAAVSVTNHIGIMGSIESVSNTSDDHDKYIKHKFWEAGLGYYENAPNNKICYEVFGGFGRGEGSAYNDFDKIFNNTNSEHILATGKYRRFFVQPSIGSNNKIFNWIVSTRVSYVDFESFTYDGLEKAYDNPVIFFEPAFTGRVNFGKSPIYSQFQVGFSVPTQGTTSFDHRFMTTSFGLGLRLGGPRKDDATREN